MVLQEIPLVLQPHVIGYTLADCVTQMTFAQVENQRRASAELEISSPDPARLLRILFLLNLFVVEASTLLRDFDD
jgi:hypothetical protein